MNLWLSGQRICIKCRKQGIQGNILVIIKPAPYSFRTKHISCFFWRTALGIHRGGGQSLFSEWIDLIVAFYRDWNTSLAIPARTAFSGSGSCNIYLWLFITELWDYQPKHALPLCSIPNQTFSPQLVTLTAHFLKGSAGSWFYWQTKWNNSFTLFPQVSILSWYFPLTLVIFLVTRVLRSAFCSPSTVFTLGVGVTLGY